MIKKSKKIKRQEREAKKKRIKLKIKTLNLKEQQKNKDKHYQHSKYEDFIKERFKELKIRLKEKINSSELDKLVFKAQGTIDRANKTGAVHRNKANRKKKQLYKIYNNSKLGIKESM